MCAHYKNRTNIATKILHIHLTDIQIKLNVSPKLKRWHLQSINHTIMNKTRNTYINKYWAYQLNFYVKFIQQRSSIPINVYDEILRRISSRTDTANSNQSEKKKKEDQ